MVQDCSACCRGSFFDLDIEVENHQQHLMELFYVYDAFKNLIGVYGDGPIMKFNDQDRS